MDLSEIYEFLFSLEKKYDLINLKIQNEYIYGSRRMYIYQKVMKELGIYDNAAHIQSTNYFSYNVRKIKSIISEVFRRATDVDSIIFQHGRQYFDKELGWIDPYTEFLKLDLINSGENIITYRLDYNYFHDDDFYLFPAYTMNNNNKNLETQEDRNSYQILDSWSRDIKNRFSICIKIANNLNNYLTNIIEKKERFKYILLKYNPRKIYLPVAYYRYPLVSAAKELGIRVIEPQHGTISIYHAGYSYPYNSYVPYFPDKILLFSHYWRDTTPLPENQCDYEYYGYKYFRRQVEKHNISEKDNSIVFISQPTIGKRLSKIAVEFANNNPNKIIYFKLHPNEICEWKSRYSELRETNVKNLAVIEKEYDLYTLLGKSELAIGVYSTALYEAVEFGCKIIIIALPGYKNLQGLIQKNVALMMEKQEIKRYRYDPNDFIELNSEIRLF